jgi:serine/threonine protein kinase
VERLRPEDPESIGPWQIVGRLGAGGMGEVFIGKKSTQLAAVKILHSHLASDQNFKSRFQREIDSIKNLQSKFIANYIDSDIKSIPAWLATEYIEGPSLKEEVEANGPLDDENWQALANSSLMALKDMSLSNVVHRDIKPSNIILTNEGAKLIDFGLAQQVDSTSLTTTGLIAGSPAWLSPEAINGKPLTTASDLFSLGSLLAYAKSGRNIWGDAPTAVVFNNIITGKVALEGLNYEQIQLVRSLHSKKPEERLIAMDAFLAGEIYPEHLSEEQRSNFKINSELIVNKFTPKAEPVTINAGNSKTSTRTIQEKKTSLNFTIFGAVAVFLAVIGIFVFNNQSSGEASAIANQHNGPTISATSTASAPLNNYFEITIKEPLENWTDQQFSSDEWYNWMCFGESNRVWINSVGGLENVIIQKKVDGIWIAAPDAIADTELGIEYPAVSCKDSSVGIVLARSSKGENGLHALVNAAAPSVYRFYVAENSEFTEYAQEFTVEAVYAN